MTLCLLILLSSEFFLVNALYADMLIKKKKKKKEMREQIKIKSMTFFTVVAYKSERHKQ